MTRRPAPVSATAFFATTFALSWVVWVPLMLVRLGALPRIVPIDAITPLGIVGVVMPAVAATCLTGRRSGQLRDADATRVLDAVAALTAQLSVATSGPTTGPAAASSSPSPSP